MRADAQHTPSVTVVVPTRDRPLLLVRAVRSILAQDYPGHIECLVVFDQSRPSLPPVEVPANRQLRVLENGRAPGLAGSRNTGILAAGQELVAFCDDDDEWLPAKLGRQVEALRSQDAIVASCGIHVCYGKRTVPRLPRTERVGFDDLLRSRRMEVHSSTILVARQDLLGLIGLIDEGVPGSYGEDYEWLLRVARAGTIVAVPEPLVRVYWHRASWFVGRWETMAAALHYLLDKYPEFRRDPFGLARIYGQIAFAYAAAGRASDARTWARRCVSLNWRQPRAYLALLVAAHLLRAETVLHLANSRGRGI